MRARRRTARDRPDAQPRRRVPLLPRRGPPAGDPPAPHRPADETEPAAPDAGRDLFHERRLRDSGAPEDIATYACSCGLVWEDHVTASVTCPHCGRVQAW